MYPKKLKTFLAERHQLFQKEMSPIGEVGLLVSLLATIIMSFKPTFHDEKKSISRPFPLTHAQKRLPSH